MQVGLGPGHIVLDGDPAPPPKGAQPPPIFGPYLLRKIPAWIKTSLGMELGLGPGDFVLDGDPAPPQFSANFYCGQTAGCIKMPFGMDVGRSPVDFVLDGDPVPLPKKGTEHPQIFGPCSLWPNGWMDQDGTWHGGRPWSSPHCARHSSPPPKRGQQSPSNFRPILLWPNG